MPDHCIFKTSFDSIILVSDILECVCACTCVRVRACVFVCACTWCDRLIEREFETDAG